MKRYTITEGEYSDYQIVAYIEGEDHLDIKAFFKLFAAEFGFPNRKDFPTRKHTYSMGYYDAVQKTCQLMQGKYPPTEEEYSISVGRYFFRWLMENTPFKEADIEEFRLDREWL